jgi:L-aminopeptidase/D-esterase-like protein
MAYLEEKRKGADVAKTKIPIVPTAVIFDFGIGDFRVRPDREMGYQACLNASRKVVEGSVGVGARKSEENVHWANSSKWMKKGVTRKQYGRITASDSDAFNTTLGVIATNAHLTKKEAHQVAQIAHSGLAKIISPLHTTFDGDLIFTISYEKKRAEVNTIGLLGEVVLIDSVKRAVTKADGLGIIPAYRDIVT